MRIQILRSPRVCFLCCARDKLTITPYLPLGPPRTPWQSVAALLTLGNERGMGMQEKKTKDDTTMLSTPTTCWPAARLSCGHVGSSDFRNRVDGCLDGGDPLGPIGAPTRCAILARHGGPCATRTLHPILPQGGCAVPPAPEPREE